MKRRLLNLLTLLSLLLCVAAVGLWARSFGPHDWLGRQDPDGFISLRSYKGRIWISWSAGNGGLYLTDSGGWHYERSRGVLHWEDFHFEGDDFHLAACGASVVVHRGEGMPFRGVIMPYWIIATALAVAPTARAAGSLRRRRRGKQGRCPSCGYDLTGNLSGVCPECGSRCEVNGGAPPAP